MSDAGRAGLARRAGRVVLCGLAVAIHAVGLRAQQVDSLPAESRDTLRLSVQQAVDRAVRFNEQVLISQAEKARTAGIVREVRAQSLPDVNATFGYTRNIQRPVLFFNSAQGVQQISIGSPNEYSFGVDVSQPLLDFSLGPARAAAKLSREATTADVERARTTVALQARTNYYDVLLNDQLALVQEKALQQARDRLDQVKQFYQAGTAAEFDLLTAQVEVDNIRPLLIAARNRLALSRNQLKRTLGLPLERHVALTDSFPEPADTIPLHAAIDTAMHKRADLASQELTVDLQQKGLQVEEHGDLPKLTLDASVLRRASSDQFLPGEGDFTQSASAGITMKLPLFDGRARAGRVQQAKATVDREQFRLRALREDARLQVQQATQAVQAALEQIAASRSNVQRAERALQIAQARFRNGLSTQVELNDAELAVTQARTNAAQASYAYAVARAQLMASMGER